MVERDVVNLEISKLEKDLDFFINEKIGKNN